MKRIKGNIGLFVALLINKVKAVFALKMGNPLIITPPLYKIIISIIDGAILCAISSSADVEYGSPRVLLVKPFMDRMEAHTI